LSKQVKNPKKYPKLLVEHNDKIYANLKAQLEHANNRELGGSSQPITQTENE
jgi:hypothetical protein